MIELPVLIILIAILPLSVGIPITIEEIITPFPSGDLNAIGGFILIYVLGLPVSIFLGLIAVAQHAFLGLTSPITFLVMNLLIVFVLSTILSIIRGYQRLQRYIHAYNREIGQETSSIKIAFRSVQSIDWVAIVGLLLTSLFTLYILTTTYLF